MAWEQEIRLPSNISATQDAMVANVDMAHHGLQNTEHLRERLVSNNVSKSRALSS